ncbi:MAG: ImmA/IrrE family metallo-endopeptidase [Gudongella sp.]|nr:ImmA/IrrE family metallo-endopeptidase [Gudongella sp.]
MNLTWIDKYIDGVIEHTGTNDIFEIYKTLDIEIKRVDKNDSILHGNEAIYIRNYLGLELVFINDSLPFRYEKFILAHELAHALLHIDQAQAAYNNKLIIKSKFELQADYFALKLLDISIDKTYYDGCTFEQVAKSLCVGEAILEYEFG